MRQYCLLIVLIIVIALPAHPQVLNKATLSSPSNGATEQPLSLTLQWESVTGATSYQLQVSTSPTFSTTEFNQSGISETSYTINSLEREKVYYWRVRGFLLTAAGSWSDVWSFSTIPNPPTAPALISPGNNSNDQPVSITCSWNGSSGATSFRVQIATDSLFTNSLYDTSVGLSSSLSVQNLQHETEYFWKVQPSNSGGTGPWSAVFRFTTVPDPPPTPVLFSPLPNATDQPTEATLVWYPTIRTTSYRVQLSQRSDFSTVIMDNSPVRDTTLRTVPLSNNMTYYWRVQSINPGGTSDWSSVSQFTTVPEVPLALTLQSPMNGATNQPTTLRLTWLRSNNATAYHVQVSLYADLSNAFIDNASVNDTSIQVESLFRDTTYYWRVAAVNSGGQGVWSAVWSFRTIPQQPAMPTISSPEDNTVIDTNSVQFSWTTVHNASVYWLQISEDSLFGTTFFNDSALTAASQRVSDLNYNTKYFWRVRAQNDGGKSLWTTPYRFTTRSQDSYAGPELVLPANGSNNQPTTVTLEWKPTLSALSYHVQVATDVNFSSIVREQTDVTTTSLTIESLDRNRTYFWRVRSRLLLFTSDWSSIWNFTTVPNPPSVPQLVTPLSGQMNVPISVHLAWKKVSSAASYHLQLSAKQDFSSFTINNASVPDTVYYAESLKDSTTYYWRVAATNAGGKSGWSSVWAFTTQKADQSIPTPLYPPPGFILDSNVVILTWNAVANAQSYWLQIANDSGFNSIVYSDSTIGSTSKKISGLLGSTVYYWRVSSNQPQTERQWSQPSSFTTGSASSSAGPSLIAPPDNSTNQPTTLTLSWNSDAGAMSYHVQVADNQNFSPLKFENSSLTNTSVQISALNYATQYYWRVRSNYLLVSSDWSSVWKFTTMPQPLSAPLLVSPANNAVDQPVIITLQWSLSSGATRYHVQVATDSSFSTLIENDSTLTSASKEIRSLSINQMYYWRVRAGNSAGWSPYSPYWTFRTKNGDKPTGIAQPATNITATSATLNAIVSANGYETTVRFQYGTTTAYGNSVDGVPLKIEDTATARKVTNTLYGLTPNTRYHYRVSTTNQMGSMESPDQTFVTSLPPYPNSITVNATFKYPMYPNPSDYHPTDYKIVGLPGNAGIRADSLMIRYKRADWEIYWDNGDSERTLIPFDGSKTFTFSAGKAFWLIKKGDLSIVQTIPTMPLDSSQEIRLPLHSGWNLITNPYDTVISWQRLQTINSTVQPIFAFNGSFVASDTFKPYQGYYFFNDTARQYLRVPYSSIFESPAPETSNETFPKSSGVQGWKVSIVLNTSGYRDTSTWLGVQTTPSTRQLHKPARFEMLPAVYFNRPQWDSKHSTFATDYRAPFEHRQLWDITVWNPANNQSSVTFCGIHSIPDRFDVYLIDRAASRTINLRKDSTYTFMPAEKTTQLTFIAGLPDSVHDILASVKSPEAYAIGNNYPNPFNLETAIPVTIPQHSDISLNIYNILGQKIRTVFAGTLEPGKYWFRWDGKNDQGIISSSGMYLYQLAAPNGIFMTRKMLLTK